MFDRLNAGEDCVFMFLVDRSLVLIMRYKGWKIRRRQKEEGRKLNNKEGKHERKPTGKRDLSILTLMAVACSQSLVQEFEMRFELNIYSLKNTSSIPD